MVCCIDRVVYTFGSEFGYIVKPFNLTVVESRLEQVQKKRSLLIENRNYKLHLEHLVEERTHELEQALDKTSRTYDETIKTLGGALDLRDSETENHCIRVAANVLILAKASGIRDKNQLRDIEWGAYLHDIGKIGVPDSILLIQFLEGAAELVRNHHESYDGKGYPRGLKGSEIPLSARLFAVADTIDAMTSDRPYRKALTIEAVCKELKRLSGIQFDPQVVEVFFSLPKAEWRV
jgi:HD-GYP domain-containing protein (c-di-GMP phosphodiesterase class II)